MQRREFIKSAGFALASLSLPRMAAAEELPFAPGPADGWRSFEVTTRIELPASGPTRVWLPLPSVADDRWIRPMGDTWQGNAGHAQIITQAPYGTRLLSAVWDADAPLHLELTSRFAARDWAVDLAHSGSTTPLGDAERALYTAPTSLIPVDGIVAETARQITAGAGSDADKARAIYEWIVVNTRRNPKTRGCGVGDIRFMLDSGDLSGKCADLNALYVGLARASGLPARDLYGVRVADSRFGYRSLGKSGDISHAQHCRAEVWLQSHGWVPVDPADVRKVVLEEKPGLNLQDSIVDAVHRRLFGAWESNWLPYNTAHDVALPGSTGPKLAFLMYPQVENAHGRLDCLDPAACGYRITAREITG